MNCPTCSKTPLQPRTRLGLSLSLCPVCQGAWLPRETIDELGRTTGLFLKERQSPAVGGKLGLRRPIWQELFDDEK